MHFLRFIILSSFLFYISCDDGDILVSEFEFENDDMEFCFSEESNETVFFNANNDDEVIYVILENTEYEGETEANIDFTVGSSTVVEYIKFSTALNANDFFCTAVASTGTIERRLTGEGGTINVSTNNEITLDGDADNDGLTNEFEGYIEGTVADNFNTLLDSDNDGLPNFIDEDDDNDNVKTIFEIYPKDDENEDIIPDEDEELIPLDTDNDGMPDFIDDDDDNDGILTRFEFSPNISSLPASNVNDDRLPLYRDATETENNTQDQEITFSNSYTIDYRTIVKTSDLQLSNSDSSITYTEFFIGNDSVTLVTENRVVLKTDGTFDIFSVDDSGNSPIDPINSGTIGLTNEEEQDNN